MLLPSWRSALSVAKDGTRGGGTDTSCPWGPGLISTRSTASVTSGTSGADSLLSGGNLGVRIASGGGSRAITQKVMARLGGVTSAMWPSSWVTFPTVAETGVALGTTTSEVETCRALIVVISST